MKILCAIKKTEALGRPDPLIFAYGIQIGLYIKAKLLRHIKQWL